MTEAEISKAVDDIALELYGQGMDRAQVKKTDVEPIQEREKA